MSFLEESWEEREEKIYKEIFFDTGPGIFLLTNETFDMLDAETIDPRWLHHGVFECPPVKNRQTWAYVTSGMSNPRESDSPEQISGLGVEFIMETKEKETWAIEVLHTLMAYNLLLSAGKMGEFPPLNYGHRVPFTLTENIQTMMFTYPVNFINNFSIKSGKVDLLQVIGITPSELEFAKKTSSDDLREQILLKTGELTTGKVRSSVV